MTRHNRTRPPARLLRSLYIWHRYIGLVSALFVIVLALTGLLLNHTHDLKLDSRYVSNPELLDWYGIHAPDGIVAYRTATLTLADLDGQLYINQSPLTGVNGRLDGAVDFQDMTIVALANQLLLLTPRGELIERLDGASGVPAGIESIGVSADHSLTVRTANGDFRTNAELLQWRPATAGQPVDWSVASELTASERRALDQAWRGTGLSVERVLQDLHSGRILGRGGEYLVDGVALLFLVLAGSGTWLWGRRRASMHTHRQKLKHPGADDGS
jgi:hypothetical protein